MISPLRRVTVPTSRMDDTIRFYTDILGMRVFYDQVMTPEEGEPSLLGPEGNRPHRLVSLQQDDYDIGMLGLIDYMAPELGVKPWPKKPDAPYPLVFVFAVDDARAIAAKAQQKGYPVVAPPHEWEIPDKGTAVGMSLLDPNGVLVEFTQLPAHDPDQRGPISPLRRVTMQVARDKMQPCIQFYEQALGMMTYYENIIASEPGQSSLGLPGVVKTHLVSLQQGGNRFGMVGLLEYLKPKVEVTAYAKKPGYPYEVILVFVVDNMDEVLARVAAYGGTLLARKRYQIPQRGMADGTMIADPNGVAIDLTQRL